MMLENSTADASATANLPTVKRYAPPNQRTRSLSRRKSGDRLERGNSFVNDGEKNQTVAARNIPITESGDAGVSSRSRLISLHGCCGGEALRLLNNRWTAALNTHNNLPEDSTERPVVYSRRPASPWGSAMLPHLLMQQTVGAKDFLSELRQAMRNANASPDD